MLLNYIITGKKISNNRNKHFKDSVKKFDTLSRHGMYNIHEVISYFYGIIRGHIIIITNKYWLYKLYSLIQAFYNVFICPLFLNCIILNRTKTLKQLHNFFLSFLQLIKNIFPIFQRLFNQYRIKIFWQPLRIEFVKSNNQQSKNSMGIVIFAIREFVLVFRE